VYLVPRVALSVLCHRFAEDFGKETAAYFSIDRSNQRWSRRLFAFLGDILIAEPNALIMFTGQRVLANTLREKLPEGCQRAEYLLRSGSIDMIVDRCRQRSCRQRTEIAQLLALLLIKPCDSLA
jgi:hypothetical protein